MEATITITTRTTRATSGLRWKLPAKPERRLRGLRALGGGIVACFGLTSAPAWGAALLGEALNSLQLDRVASGLTQPTDVVALPDGTLVITQRLGDVAVVRPDGSLSEAANHIAIVSLNAEQGLLGVVADVDFASDRQLYFYASAGANTEDKHKVLRVRFGTDDRLGDAITIIDKGLVGFLNHAGGGLIIHEHQLYVSVGDTGANATPPYNQLGTCLNSPNGKILRVNLDGSVPVDNPLANLTAVTGCKDRSAPLEPLPPDKRIYAWGLRNPFRFAIDAASGLLWIADVGESAKEEVDVGGIGSHFGWPFYEGTVHYSQAQQPFQPEGACLGISPPGPCVPP